MTLYFLYGKKIKPFFLRFFATDLMDLLRLFDLWSRVTDSHGFVFRTKKALDFSSNAFWFFGK
jgi:hypothetical protein